MPCIYMCSPAICLRATGPSWKDAGYTHCLTPHIADSSSTSHESPTHLSQVPLPCSQAHPAFHHLQQVELQYPAVDYTHCWVSHVAALVLQALKAHAFISWSSSPSLWLKKLKQLVGNHNIPKCVQHSKVWPTCTYICTYVHHANTSPIQSPLPMCSALIIHVCVCVFV